jgi:hypothetical protein
MVVSWLALGSQLLDESVVVQNSNSSSGVEMDSSRPCTLYNQYICEPCDGSCDTRPGFSTRWPAVPTTTSDGTGQARQPCDCY